MAIVCLWQGLAFGQGYGHDKGKSKTACLRFYDHNKLIQEEVLNLPNQDSLSVQQAINKQIKDWYKQGYLMLDVDSVKFTKPCTHIYINMGIQVQFKQVLITGIPATLPINENNIKLGKTVPISDWPGLLESCLETAENNGYPFASIKPDSIYQDSIGQLYGKMRFKPGPYIIWDTLAITGDLSMKPKFLSRYLRLYQGEAFSQEKLKAANNLFKRFPFLKAGQFPQTKFGSGRAFPIFFANKMPCNQVDGIVGFLPNEENKGTLLVTGEFNLKLYNLFQTAKTLTLAWQSIKKGSQKLDLGYQHPALLGTPLVFDFNFNLLKEDSSFLNRKARVALAWQYMNGSKLGFFTDYNASSVLRQQVPENAKASLPDISGYTYTGYGLNYQRVNLDNYFYPHYGNQVSAEASAGNKQIEKFQSLPASAYDTVKLNSVQVYLKLFAEHYVGFGRKSVWLGRVNSGYIANNRLLRNELFRLGGLNTLRGFNENFFFASGYAIATAEYRFFLEAQSYLQVFIDQGAYTYNAFGTSYTDLPTGIGAGISFTSQGGVFTISYALGRNRTQTFDYSTSKVHFGLVGRF